jgi:NADH-quinone oxidoreductase subunit N
LGGFFGKFFLFSAAVEAGYVWLAIVGVLNAILALYYYLTVIKVMYVDPNLDQRPIVTSQSYAMAMIASAAAILIMGTLAAPWFSWALDAAGSLAAALP